VIAAVGQMVLFDVAKLSEDRKSSSGSYRPLVWAPNGKWFFSVGTDRSILYFYDAQTGDLIHEHHEPEGIQTSNYAILSTNFSNTTRLATICNSNNTKSTVSVRLVEVTTENDKLALVLGDLEEKYLFDTALTELYAYELRFPTENLVYVHNTKAHTVFMFVIDPSPTLFYTPNNFPFGRFPSTMPDGLDTQVWKAHNVQVISNANTNPTTIFVFSRLAHQISGVQYSGVTRRNTFLVSRKYGPNYTLFWEEEIFSHKLVRSGLIPMQNQPVNVVHSIKESHDSKYLYLTSVGVGTVITVVDSETLTPVKDSFVWPGLCLPVVCPTDSSLLVFNDTVTDTAQVMCLQHIKNT